MLQTPSLVIGIMGETGAGKTTLANALAEQLDFKAYAFADALKRQCATAFKLSESAFSDRATKTTPQAALAPGKSLDKRFEAYAFSRGYVSKAMLSPRQVMQLFSDYTKDKFSDEAIYAIELNSTIRAEQASRVVISDVRYPHEVEMVRRFPESLIIHLSRNNNPYKEERPQHESDQDLRRFASVCHELQGIDPSEVDMIVAWVKAGLASRVLGFRRIITDRRSLA